MCKLISRAVTVDGTGWGACRVVARCETHSYVMDPAPPITADTLCPFGRIERAIEDGLAKIAAAVGVPREGT